MPTLPQLLQAILERKIILYVWTTNWHLPRALRRQWQPTPVLLPGKSHGQRSLVGCSPWGRWGSDTTERLHFHFLLSCIGEGNGNLLQCSCLENPRDGGAWWAAVYGVAQSRTRLKQRSRSSSSKSIVMTEQQRHLPSASTEIEPHATIAADLQHPRGSSGWREALYAPGNLVGWVFT